MQSFIKLAKGYQSYHTKRITVYTHFIGVPLVILSLMIAFGCIKISVPGYLNTDLAWILTVAVVIYYTLLNWKLGLATLPLLLLLLWVSILFNHDGPHRDTLNAFLITFIVGWGFQLAGHFFEGKRPAFVDNLFQALIAPMFLVAEILIILGLSYDLKCQLHGED